MHHHSQFKVTRRGVLACGAASAAAALSGGVHLHASPSSRGSRDTLLIVFLRGGLDGVSLCVPYGDDHYYGYRPTHAVPPSNVLNIDGYFGLNVAAAPLMPLYESGRLAFINAVGIEGLSRSHFEAMRRTEEASTSSEVVGTGWLARHLQATPAVGTGVGRAIATADTLPRTMFGSDGAVPIPNLATFGRSGPASTSALRAGYNRAMYGATREPDRSLGLAAHDMLDQLDMIDFIGRTPDGGAVYPNHSFGKELRDAATVIKAGLTVEAMQIDFGGWDDHRNLGVVDGPYAQRIRVLSSGLSALMTDLGPDAERTTVLVMSEFGRRLDENGAGGTDHGAGGLAMVLGGSHVNGGIMHGTWPGLAQSDLDDEALAVTSDIRDVIGEILKVRMGDPDAQATLLGHQVESLGLFLG